MAYSSESLASSCDKSHARMNIGRAISRMSNALFTVVFFSLASLLTVATSSKKLDQANAYTIR